MKYTRIYSDATGESHFEDLMVHVAPVEFAPPAPPLNMSEPIASENTLLCSIPGDWEGSWHPSPKRQFYLQLSGRLEVQTSDGESRTFTTGSLVLLEDTSGKGHYSRVLGYSSVHAVFIQLADENKT